MDNVVPRVRRRNLMPPPKSLQSSLCEPFPQFNSFSLSRVWLQIRWFLLSLEISRLQSDGVDGSLEIALSQHSGVVYAPQAQPVPLINASLAIFFTFAFSISAFFAAAGT